MKAKIGMARVATEAGVSLATVSRVLGGKPGVGAETRRRVIAIAERLQYVRPETVHMQQRRGDVGFLIAISGESQFYAVMMVAAARTLRAHGLDLIPIALGDASRESLRAELDSRRFAGFIAAGPSVDAALLAHLAEGECPVVLIDNQFKVSPLDIVLNDDVAGAYAAVRHLLAHGHRRIACLSGPAKWVSNRARIQGCREAMAEAGPTERLVVVHQDETTIQSGYAAMTSALRHDVSAAFCINDYMAMGALQAAAEVGRRVPDDLAVIGFDDIFAAQGTQPPLTTVAVDKERIGVVAAERLERRIESGASPTETTLVGCRLVLRRSCGCQSV